MLFVMDARPARCRPPARPRSVLAEGLARAVELLSAKVHAMLSSADDVEPFVRFVVQIAVAALSLLPDGGAGLLRDLGELTARERR